MNTAIPYLVPVSGVVFPLRQLLWLATGTQWFIAGLLAWLLATEFGWLRVLAWLGLLFVALGLRNVLLARAARRLGGTPSPQWDHWLTGGALAVNGAWGASSLLLLANPAFGMGTLVQGYVLAGVAAGASALYAPHPRAATVAIIATLAPLALVHLFLGGTAHVVAAGATVVFTMALLVVSSHFSRIAERASRAHAENADLSLRLEREVRRRVEEAEAARRRELEQEAAHEARYRQLFASFRDPIILLDVSGAAEPVIVSLNPAAQDLLNTDEQAARRRPLARFMDGAFGERLGPAARECGRTGIPARHALELRCRNGLRSFDVTVMAIRNQEGFITRVAAVCNDVTLRTNAERELREALAFSEGIINAIPDILVEADSAGRCLNAWTHSAEFLGWHCEMLVGRTVSEALPATAAATALEALAEAAVRGTSTGKTLRVGRGGRESWFELSVSRKPDSAPDSPRFLVLGRDVTERKLAERRLEEARARLQSVMRTIPDLLWMKDTQGVFRSCNPEFCRRLGVTEAEVIGKTDLDLWGPELAAAFERRDRDAIRAGDLCINEEWVTFCDGRRVLLETRKMPVYGEHGEVAGVLGVARDVSELRRAEALLHAREEAFRSLAENSPDTIVRYDRDYKRVYVNPAFESQAGLPAGSVVGQVPSHLEAGEDAGRYLATVREVFATGDIRSIELNWRSGDGRHRCAHVRIVPEYDREGRIESVLAVGRDISEIDSYRRRIATLAFYDPMTGLANRALFNDRLQQLVDKGQRDRQVAGVLLLDLDRFKTINDSLGHAAGDALLQEAGRRLAGAVRGYDTVARLGGDEFAVLLPELRSAADAGTVAHKILDAFTAAFNVEGRELFVTTSAGIALFPGDGHSAEELLKHADSAMYHAKARGGNTFQFYRVEMTRRAQERLQLEGHLRKALDRGELGLHYQPQVMLDTRRPYGAEALLRWNSPVLGNVPPERFIPIAEDTGLIGEIGAWVMEEACRTAAAWNGAGHALRVAVNLSTRQFRRHRFGETVLQSLARTGCRPEWLELEITESLLLEQNDEVVTTMNTLRGEGLTFAIDDFGTGYSALGYLQRFPIDAVKVDRSFIHGITRDRHAAGLVRAMVAMTDVLRLAVVAEGVESEEQCAMLRQWGGGIQGQGELFGRPMAREEFERVLLPPV